MDLTKRLEGKVALVTGGGAGIGLAGAIRMAQEGANIGIAELEKNRAREAKTQVEAAGGQAVAVPCDVAIPEDNEKAVKATVEAFGRLDILVTCAGIHGGGGSVVQTPLEIWDKVMDIDLKGAYLSSKYALPEMQKLGAGSVIHVSSIHGLTGTGSVAFNSAKGGLINLTRHMAIVHARENIRANCLCPGVVHTPLTEGWLVKPEIRAKVAAAHPMNRVAMPEEIGSVIAFMASDDASFITGAILPVDGGFMADGSLKTA